MIVLPNNKNIVPVAEQVPELTELPVAVVPTAAVVEALAALVVYDPDASLDANVAAMDEAAARVRAGEVTQAVRDSVAECGPIADRRLDRDHARRHPGRREVGRRRRGRAARRAGRRRRASSSRSSWAPRPTPTTPRASPSTSASAHPHVEVELHHGDQPLYPYLIGVE